MNTSNFLVYSTELKAKFEQETRKLHELTHAKEVAAAEMRTLLQTMHTDNQVWVNIRIPPPFETTGQSYRCYGIGSAD